MNDINSSIAAEAANDIDAISSRYGLSFAAAVTRNVAAMLAEDVGSGDLSAALIDAQTIYRARVISRESAILCGTPWFNEVVRQVDPSITLRWLHQDGDRVVPDAVLVELEGPARSLLTAERNALNFVQLLSGVATAVRTYVDAVAGTRARIIDTRKTIPGLRLAQKYAVAVGGGANHRLGLYDAILLKENHIAALGGVGPAVDATKADKNARFVRVEVESIEQLEIALTHGAKSILLDNFSLDMMTEAVAKNAGRATLEASGNVNMQTVVAIANTGVDQISIGALTKDVRAVDLSMRFTSDAA